jgi:hypothetical protein
VPQKGVVYCFSEPIVQLPRHLDDRKVRHGEQRLVVYVKARISDDTQQQVDSRRRLGYETKFVRCP